MGCITRKRREKRTTNEGIASAVIPEVSPVTIIKEAVPKLVFVESEKGIILDEDDEVMILKSPPKTKKKPARK